MDQHDIKNLSTNDKVFLGAGILVFIASFFPYWGVSVDGAGAFPGGSESTTAWHSYATLALLLLLASLLLGAVVIFSRTTLPDISISWNVIVLGLAALGALLLIIRSFTLESGDSAGFSYGLRWGAYVLMILALVQTVFAFLRTKDAGDAMPWEGRGSGADTAPPPPAV